MAAAVSVLLAVLGLLAWLTLPEAPLRLAEPVELVAALPLPPELEPPEPDLPAATPEIVPPAIGSTAAVIGAPPLEALTELATPGPYGDVPSRSAELSPWQAYRRTPADLSPSGRIALLVIGLGLDPVITEDAAHLSSDISLAFSPYGDETADWMRYARWQGHEVLMTLPLEPEDYPIDNPGPVTLFSTDDRAAIDDGLTWLMAQGEAYVGFSGPVGVFNQRSFEPIALSLKERGLGYVELDGQDLGAMAQAIDLPYLGITRRIDEDLAPAAIAAALEAIEKQAIAGGTALAYTRPYPLVFDMIEEWTAQLDEKGLTLVPLTSILAEPSG